MTQPMTEAHAAGGRNGQLMRLATRLAVATAGVLIAVKLAAWLLTDSVAMLSTLVDSLLDALASLVNLFAVHHALQPADREHRFGHGKAEALAGLGQAAFISGSAVFLLLAAGQRLLSPKPIAHSEIGIGVMAVSIAVTLGLVYFQRHVVRRTGSLAIQADSLHYLGDLLTNGAVILALVLAGWLGWVLADPILGAGLAGYILYNAWQIGRAALDVLMDRELPDDDRERIRRIALAHPEVVSLHDLRTRSSGQQIFVQLHLEMAPTLSLLAAHQVADAVEAEICAAFPEAEVIIHQDPAGFEQPHSRVAR